MVGEGRVKMECSVGEMEENVQKLLHKFKETQQIVQGLKQSSLDKNFVK
jgi:hypothetical protein